MLAFTEFQLEADYDFVRVYDGPDSSAPLLAQLSGSAVPDNIIGTTSTIFVKFESDFSMADHGFVAIYSGFSGDELCFDCEVGKVSSAGISGCFECHPGTYIATTAGTVCLECVAGKFQSDYGATGCESCSPGTFSAIAAQRACTSCPPGKFTESQSSVCLDCPAGKFGPFSGQAPTPPTSQCAGLKNEAGVSGSIGNGPGALIGMDCSWRISIAQGSIAVYFKSFDLATTDFVDVYDGVSSSSTLIGRYSGTQEPFVLQSTTSELLVNFQSGDSASHAGFLLIGAAMPGRCRAAVVPLGTSVPAPKSSAAHVPPAVFGMMLRIAAFVLLVRSAERLQPLASIAKLDNMLTKVPWSALSARKGCIRISLDHRIAANVLLVSIRQVLNRRRRFWPPRPPD